MQCWMALPITSTEMRDLLPDFETVGIDLPGATIHARVGGSGPPLLLLHGYPQTHAMWHPIAVELAKSHRVIATDLRGYGASVCKDDNFTFRAMATDQVKVMQALGHDRFDVVSHDRGARTAHRMVLDHPEAVLSVVLMDILPTLEVWRTMDAWLAKRYFHWVFLAQPGGIPADLIRKDPIQYLHASLKGLTGGADIMHPDAMKAYEIAANTPGVVEAWCGDYAAAATIDLDHDRADEGRKSDIPCLVLWGSKGVVHHHVDPLKTWQAWFPNATGQPIDAGHFLVEERPVDTLQAVQAHLSAVR